MTESPNNPKIQNYLLSFYSLLFHQPNCSTLKKISTKNNLDLNYCTKLLKIPEVKHKEIFYPELQKEFSTQLGLVKKYTDLNVRLLQFAMKYLSCGDKLLKFHPRASNNRHQAS